MKEQEIKDILEKQREFFRSGETISVESHPHPLAFYFFSESKAAQKKMLDRCRFGGGCISPLSEIYRKERKNIAQILANMRFLLYLFCKNDNNKYI